MISASTDLITMTVIGMLSIPLQVYMAAKQDRNPSANQPESSFGYYIRFIPFLGFISNIARQQIDNDY